MPIFKTTYNILKVQDQDELFSENWMDVDKVYLPPSTNWDYRRELQLEDINIWEVIYELSGGWGLYAAWDPYAEFYLLTNGTDTRNFYKVDGKPYQSCHFETFYGANARKKVYKKLKSYGIDLPIFKQWVPEEDMWIYTEQSNVKSIII
jgi:hypothetical protein